MPVTRDIDIFWGTLERNVEKGAVAANANQHPRGFFFVMWHICAAPLMLFIRLCLSGAILGGRSAIRGVVHASMAQFAVAARRYELDCADTGKPKRISVEWNIR